MKTTTLDYNLKRDFSAFGRNIYLVAIFSLIGLIPYVSFITTFLALIFTIISFGPIKRINYQLNDPSLRRFRSKYIHSLLLGILGVLFIVVGFVTIIVFAFFLGLGASFLIIIAAFIALILAVVIISALLEIQAWKSLNLFFMRNKFDFPESMSKDAIDGTKFIKYSIFISLMFILGVLVFIAFIIGAILVSMSSLISFSLYISLLTYLNIFVLVGTLVSLVRVVGLFKLGHLRFLGENQFIPQKFQQPNVIYTPHINAPLVAPEKYKEVHRQFRYCPHCGDAIADRGQYCASCGTKIN